MSKKIVEALMNKIEAEPYYRKMSIFKRVEYFIRYVLLDIKLKFEEIMSKIKDLKWFFDVYRIDMDNTIGLLMLIQLKLFKIYNNCNLSDQEYKNIAEIIDCIDQYMTSEDIFDEKNKNRLSMLCEQCGDDTIPRHVLDVSIQEYIKDQVNFEQELYDKIWDLLKKNCKNLA